MALSYIDTLTFSAAGGGERNMDNAIVCDYVNGFVYVGYQTGTNSRSGITKIRESDFTRVASLDYAGAALSSVNPSAGIDIANGRAHFISYSATSGRLKYLDLNTFTVGLDTFFGVAGGQIIYAADGVHLYSTLDADNTVKKIHATNLGTVATSAALSPGDVPMSLVPDFSRDRLYVGHNDTSGQIHTLRMSDLAVLGNTATGLSGHRWSGVDSTLDVGFFVANNLLKLNLATGGFSSPLPGISMGTSVKTAPNLGYLYMVVSPKVLREIDASTFATVSSVDLATPLSGANPRGIARNPLTGMLYIIGDSNPGRLLRVQGTPDPPTTVPVSGGPNVKRRPYPYNGATISSAW